MYVSLFIGSLLLVSTCLSQNKGINAANVSKTVVKSKGNTFVNDGVKLYYEIYGSGEPLLLVHGNGGSGKDFVKQIPYFSKHFRVIAMDSRDQGRSGDSAGTLTYEKMADDLSALLDHLKIKKAYVLGWSDGGINGLLLAIRHPDKVIKLASMAANLNPSDKAVHPDVLNAIKGMASGMPAPVTAQQKRESKVMSIMLAEPNIDPKLLNTISAPTLVMAGDHDVICDEHTVEIFHNIPNSQLVIFPNSTHMAAFDDPVLFNSTADRFFRTPFVKRDRVNDLFKSLEKLRSGH